MGLQVGVDVPASALTPPRPPPPRPRRRAKAQVLNEGAAQKKLGKVNHRKNLDVPVMFFGTLEIAWIGKADIVRFREGVQQGYHVKGKHKSFVKAVGQVRARVKVPSSV